MRSIQDLMLDTGVAFGTSGVRGLVTQMSGEICAAYTQAFLTVLKQSYDFDSVAIGIDLRPSSPQIAQACAATIEANGLKIDFCGELPTPALAYYAQKQGIPAIMVTGSHIPFDRNGMKFYRPDGEISKADELAMINLPLEMANKTISAPRLSINPKAIIDYENRYLDFFPADILSGMKLGFYQHASVARDVLKNILEKLGAQVVSLDRTEVFVPIDTEAVSDEDKQRGKNWSQQYGFDAILSTDGDGDRPLIADENGHWLRGDLVGLITSDYLGIQQIAIPVSCNTAIELSGSFDQVKRTKIGSPYVIAAMESLDSEQGHIAGFEANGGFLLANDIETQGKKITSLATRDAALPIIAVLAAAQKSSAKLSDLLLSLPKRYTDSDRLQNFPTQLSQSLLASWANDPNSFGKLLGPEYSEISACDLSDGLRLSFSNQDIIHIRASGNAPELRCYCESSDYQKALDMTQMVLNMLKQYNALSLF
jgi:phosphomannomutase